MGFCFPGNVRLLRILVLLVKNPVNSAFSLPQQNFPALFKKGPLLTGQNREAQIHILHGGGDDLADEHPESFFYSIFGKKAHPAL
jgi:hypothetical protein